MHMHSHTLTLKYAQTHIHCSKASEENFQFWKLSAVVLDAHINCVDKVHKGIESTLVP